MHASKRQTYISDPTKDIGMEADMVFGDVQPTLD